MCDSLVDKDPSCADFSPLINLLFCQPPTFHHYDITTNALCKKKLRTNIEVDRFYIRTISFSIIGLKNKTLQDRKRLP